MVPSPCIDVCRMNAQSGWCEGCARSLDEIAAWAAMTDVQKMAVWHVLPARRRIVDARGAAPAATGASPPKA
jgi:uncharacterized protein